MLMPHQLMMMQQQQQQLQPLPPQQPEQKQEEEMGEQQQQQQQTHSPAQSSPEKIISGTFFESDIMHTSESGATGGRDR